ncbi:thioesterase II family protein [Streptomyces sp. TRM49041]|uniref:thioesterase II family protein n=1 Tax=Streptomyces sp. TRM49041 TaxID=2603216 RepID=UPI0011EC6905|nr:alpha/beta fold hydrolase [Streptomyces sp. TRM49041]
MTDTPDPASDAVKTPESRWLSSRRQKTDTALDLFCFAHAGGSAGEFLRWSGGLPGVRLWAVKLPGRAPRQDEPPYTRMTALVDDLVAQVEFGRRDFAFFGHSLGALVAFEAARALRRAGRRQPSRLLLSSMQPPPITTRQAAHRLPGDELLAEVERRWGALPRAIHDDPELREIVLGYFRADAELAETYAYVPEDPLDVPVTVFAGDQEDRDQLGWHVHTRAECDTHVLRGGHFYFRDPEQQRELLRLIGRALSAEK